ncbi:hypothetical protein DXB97_04365 [Firmicutes bacterium OM07-11]|nr:hypothetical protein DXB97_04365 [Firmicutes bacterium OM07-11]
MQNIEHVEGQELNTTEQKLEVYTDRIQESISNYCIDHDIDIKDIYTFDQQRWNSVLLYIYSQVFKPCKNDGVVRRYNEKSNIDYSNRELINNICDIYIAMCYEYSKEVSVMGFSKMTGITLDTLYQWVNNPDVERGSSEIVKNLQAEREESLSNKLASGKGNPVGILGILNRHYGWNMGQPRGQTATQKAPDLPGMAQKYLESEEPVKNEPVPLELPQADF